MAATAGLKPTSDLWWASTPLQLLSTIGPTERSFSNKIGAFYAGHMAAIHNIIMRGFNASYNQANLIRPRTQEAADFLLFNQFIYEFISNHHTVEDNIFFPDVEAANKSPGSMSANSEQHQTFHDGIEEFGKYAYNTTKDEYDPKRLVAILDSFRNPMQKHLADEVTTFLDLKDENEDALMKVHYKGRDHAIAEMDKYRVAPLLFACHDKTFKIDGKTLDIEAPVFVPYLNEYFYARRYRGAWKYVPCTMWQEPKVTMSAKSKS